LLAEPERALAPAIRRQPSQLTSGQKGG